MSRLRLLIVEDDPADALLVVRFLEKAGLQLEWERVEDREGLAAALAKPWDAVVSDWSLPAFGAKEALKVLQARGLDLPFLIMSGTIGEETAVEAMRLGAHDFVLKDRLTRLPLALEREIREAKVRAERAKADAALRRSEERFRLAAAATEEVLWTGIWSWGRSGGARRSSAASATPSGRPRRAGGRRCSTKRIGSGSTPRWRPRSPATRRGGPRSTACAGSTAAGPTCSTGRRSSATSGAGPCGRSAR